MSRLFDRRERWLRAGLRFLRRRGLRGAFGNDEALDSSKQWYA
jgi:hypothetical protein